MLHHHFSTGKAAYFRSLPLHTSQKEIETTPDYSIFEYKIKPTYDFEQEILSHREDVEVLEPVSLRETIKQSIMKMAKLYQVRCIPWRWSELS